VGLRELKKQRTRDTITRVAYDLFEEKGFAATTLADISTAAEIAPSTLHSYFPSKDSIVLDGQRSYRETVSARIAARPASQSTLKTISIWLTQRGTAEHGSDTEAARRRRVIERNDPLRARERLDQAIFEDQLADAFARDLAEPASSLRCRAMAAAAAHVLTLCELPRTDCEEALRLLEATLSALHTIPRSAPTEASRAA